MINGFLKIYNALGNNKGQRFRRFFMIIALIVGLIAYGFYSGEIAESIKAWKTSSSQSQEK